MFGRNERSILPKASHFPWRAAIAAHTPLSFPVPVEKKRGTRGLKVKRREKEEEKNKAYNLEENGGEERENRRKEALRKKEKNKEAASKARSTINAVPRVEPLPYAPRQVPTRQTPRNTLVPRDLRKAVAGFLPSCCSKTV